MSASLPVITLHQPRHGVRHPGCTCRPAPSGCSGDGADVCRSLDGAALTAVAGLLPLKGRAPVARGARRRLPCPARRAWCAPPAVRHVTLDLLHAARRVRPSVYRTRGASRSRRGCACRPRRPARASWRHGRRPGAVGRDVALSLRSLNVCSMASLNAPRMPLTARTPSRNDVAGIVAPLSVVRHDLPPVVCAVSVAAGVGASMLAPRARSRSSIRS
jgi:hypothetical protein